MTNLEVKSNLRWGFRDYFHSLEYLGDTAFLFLKNYELSSQFDNYNIVDMDLDKTKENDLKAFKLELLGDNKKTWMSCNIDILIFEYLYNNGVGGRLMNLEPLLNKHNIVYKNVYKVYEVLDPYNYTYQILVNVKEYKEFKGEPIDDDEMREYLTYLLDYTPIFGDISINFEYTNNKGVKCDFKHSFDYDDINEKGCELSFVEDYIIKSINTNLIDYKLTEQEVNAVLEASNNIEDTDIRG